MQNDARHGRWARGCGRETRMQDTPGSGDGDTPSAGQAWAIRRASRSATGIRLRTCPETIRQESETAGHVRIESDV